MADEVIQELWTRKDAIAKEADYDIDKLMALLQTRQDQRKQTSATPSPKG